MKGNSDKDVAEEMRVLARLGWTYEGVAGDGHHVLTHGELGKIRLPGSPSSPRWRPAFRQRLAKRMGMTKPELEVFLGERPPKVKGGTEKKKPKKKREKPHRIFETSAGRPTESQPASMIPRDPSEGITEERRRAWRRQQEENARAAAGADFPWRSAA